MYLLYADESGDPGMNGGPSDFFVISGVIIHESDWNEIFQRIVDLRRLLGGTYGLPQRIAWHATDIVNQHGDFHHSRHGIQPDDCFAYYHAILQALAQLNQIRILNVFVRKDHLPSTTTAEQVYEIAWQWFVQRFSNFLEKGGTRGVQETGLLITDRTQDDILRRLLRRMRAFNFVPSMYSPGSRPVVITRILDDPVPRNSTQSYFVQVADIVAFSLARRDYPRARLNTFGFNSFFDILDPVLLKPASTYNPQGIVYYPR